MPEPDTDESAADLTTRQTIAGLEEAAEQWAADTDLTATVAAIANTDDRESRIEALMKLAYMEGATGLFFQAKDDGILDTTLPAIRDEIEMLREHEARDIAALHAIRRITGDTHRERPYTALSQIDQIARTALT